MRLLWIQLALGLFQTDLAVKHEVDERLEFGQEYSLLNGRVRVLKHHNRGMAGGSFTGHMPAIIRISGISTIVCIAVFFKLLWEGGHPIDKAGFAFLTGGALSNLYDRCRKGYVVDYISFRTPWKRLNRLIFNISDFFILAGALLICLGQTDHTQG